MKKLIISIGILSLLFLIGCDYIEQFREFNEEEPFGSYPRVIEREQMSYDEGYNDGYNERIKNYRNLTSASIDHVNITSQETKYQINVTVTKYDEPIVICSSEMSYCYIRTYYHTKYINTEILSEYNDTSKFIYSFDWLKYIQIL